MPSAQAELGKRLFFDARLSSDARVSCASCHQPQHAFSDGRRLAVGVESREGTRNTPSLLGVSSQRLLFWDGRRTTLESQALDPLLNPLEHGLTDTGAILTLLNRDAGYVAQFERAFVDSKGPITLERISAALAAFQRTLDDGESPFDRYLSGDAHAITPQALHGWQIFSGRAQCTRCHVAEGGKALLTDHGFHALGVGLRDVQRKLPQLAMRLTAAREAGNTPGHELLADADIAALGRFVVTLDPADIGKFKTPSLRNVALTAPYMHDGSVATLAEAVDIELYYRSIESTRPVILTPAEKSDLLVFLESLSGSNARQHQSGGRE
ncbi:cytochrome-c peroxidase [Aquabacterium humicola]|uniref:cytochrome-c peroxidase n=1 Tax=Aquabacterium humicola TaxID=3237377 RepID=UPI0025430200|nr:cytochrome c peroxidase [Rubrivivax pictus]